MRIIIKCNLSKDVIAYPILAIVYPIYRPIKLIKTYLLYNNSVLCLLPASTRLPRGIRLVLAVKRLKMRGFTALSQHHTPLGLTFFPQALRLAELAIGIDAINSINTLLK